MTGVQTCALPIYALWHNHLPDTSKTKMSGIYYAHIPADVEDIQTCGTEFAPNGLNSSERFFVAPTKKKLANIP